MQLRAARLQHSHALSPFEPGSQVVSGLMDMSSGPSFTKPAARDKVMEGHTAAALAAYHRQASSKPPAAKAKANRRVPSIQVVPLSWPKLLFASKLHAQQDCHSTLRAASP